ncbi:hypothetical protein K432DRAFT_457306 [Lepidopterella palustris CBS 459.81]|uniref:Uncharacterized protein n=1 Tax=Lepidopterella palustris CBS 459.81 TaxID=1314670 RepID=A0A8E2JDK1_9PEZI|nr:hypothetical protein K432DRAFT_457306 [Lepidopterella palustris CBS 459.81]
MKSAFPWISTNIDEQEDRISKVATTIDQKLESTEQVVIDCFYSHDCKNAPLSKTDYDYTNLLKLRSDNPFSLIKSVLLDDGEYKGHVALIIKQSYPFPFMKLNASIRARIYRYLLEAEENTIRIKTKATGHKLPYAPGYTSAHKLAIVTASKEVRKEALPILYNQKFCFDNTTGLQLFLLVIGECRLFVKNLSIDAYVSSTARTAFYLLGDCKNLNRIFFKHVSSNQQPKTAIKDFWNDAQPWLMQASQDNKEDPMAVLKLMAFDPAAYHMRSKDLNTGETVVKMWGRQEHLVFLKGLKSKLLGQRVVLNS